MNPEQQVFLRLRRSRFSPCCQSHVVLSDVLLVLAVAKFLQPELLLGEVGGGEVVVGEVGPGEDDGGRHVVKIIVGGELSETELLSELVQVRV